jgi:dipeptidyl aminopeptidase/acylaminoacyl peptidase
MLDESGVRWPRRSRSLIVAGLVVSVLGVAAGARPAHAAFPGVNGRIVFTSIAWWWDASADVWSMNADGSAPVNLTNHPAYDVAPTFSPDGSRIAFASDRDGDQEIYVMDADGSDPTRVTTAAGNDSDPAFSADGSRIAFTSDRDGNRELYVIGVDGTDETRLTASAADEADAAFSADGTRLAYSSDQDGDAEIYVMAPDGSDPVRLTDNAASDAQPSFSPDSLSLAFTSDRDGGIRQVFVMNRDGSAQVKVTDDAAFRYGSAPTFSPDGSRIAFRSDSYCPPGYGCAAILTGGIRVRNRDGSGETHLGYDDGSNYEPDWGVATSGSLPAAPPDPAPDPAPDATPPETQLASGPSGPTNDSAPTFAFTGSDDVTATGQLEYSTRLDHGEWSTYSSHTSVTLAVTDGSHTISVRARDAAGSEDATPAERSFTVDTVAPTGSLTINYGALQTRTRTVTLTLSGGDPAPSTGITEMRISNTASGLAAAPWSPYARARQWTLTYGAGTKTVYVQYRDAATNVSPVAQDTIRYTP